MTLAVSVKVTGAEELERALKKLSPEQSQEILTQSLLDCAHLVQENAAREQIIGGGVFMRAKIFGSGMQRVDAAPHKTKLTSRTGTLRGSIAVNRRPLPLAIEVGTHLKYGRAHELGFSGMQWVTGHWRTITKAFGKSIPPRSIQVDSHARDMTLPKRPFLVPAVKATEKRFPEVFMANWKRYGT